MLLPEAEADRCIAPPARVRFPPPVALAARLPRREATRESAIDIEVAAEAAEPTEEAAEGGRSCPCPWPL